MGQGARALSYDPNATREMQTFWDGMIEIDVSATDYNAETTLSTVWVRAIESGDTSGGNAIKIDHWDFLGSGGPPARRTGVTIYVKECIPKSPMPVITKIYKTGTTAAKIKLYYQRKRA